MMNDEPIQTPDMVEVTDCFEAVRVLRLWRSVFFSVAVACMVLLQGTFWLVDTGAVRPSSRPAVTEASTDSARPEDAAPSAGPGASPRQGRAFGLSFAHLARLVQVANGVLLLAALLYWLTILFTLGISIVGRLGGINHICRAFFLSLVVLVVLIPWQHFVDSIVVGATFGVQELADSVSAKVTGVSGWVLHYVRFPAYSLAVLAVLILAHRRSSRWARVVLHRLEIV
ncbi:MAG: hypothetical protein KBE04_06120 [Phycisphaerae bacterium]|nr:hypothetical protein [Phycisphaerae bacterium]